ncbi:MAG: DNA repair protein RecO [Bacteroidetes bacterium]|nr:DNA repair protein RecO [Bacteroidota bacterium]
MLHSTKGIVFHTIKYSETSVIAKIYTELFGIQSYLLKGIRNSRSKIKPGLFQSMTLLDLVVYHKERQSLQSVKEVQLAHPYKTIPFDIRKSSVALFINELVYKAIREEEPNAGLFGFLWQTFTILDQTEENVSGFHLQFAVRLMHHLGIFPQNNYSEKCPVFDLREGMFRSIIPDHQHYLDPLNSKIFSDILNPESEIRNLKSEIRNHLLETILLYYQLHLPGFGGVQSHHILHEVLA